MRGAPQHGSVWKEKQWELLGSWHINTQKQSSAADYQVSTQPVRGDVGWGAYDSTTEVCVDLQIITSYPEHRKPEPFSFFYKTNFKAGLKQDRAKVRQNKDFYDGWLGSWEGPHMVVYFVETELTHWWCIDTRLQGFKGSKKHPGYTAWQLESQS